MNNDKLTDLFESALIAEGYRKTDFKKHDFGQYYLSHLNMAFVYFCKGVNAVCNQESS